MLPAFCCALILPTRSGALAVDVVTELTMSGLLALKSSIIPWVSCRSPATSRMFSVTGLLGLRGTALLTSALGPALGAEGAPQASSAATPRTAEAPMKTERRGIFIFVPSAARAQQLGPVSYTHLT